MIVSDLVFLANELFVCGAVQFGAFKLKLHETQPDAPLSPIYFNLRTSDNPKPGPLTPDMVSMIGRRLFELVDNAGLAYDCVAGIPHAGDPFAIAFCNARIEAPPRIQLQKNIVGDQRIITQVKSGEVKERTVLLVDDLITQAHSKQEAASAIEKAGGKVAGFVVILDREQGGSQQLKDAGKVFLSLFSITNLLDHYVQSVLLSEEKRAEVLAYIANNQ